MNGSLAVPLASLELNTVSELVAKLSTMSLISHPLFVCEPLTKLATSDVTVQVMNPFAVPVVRVKVGTPASVGWLAHVTAASVQLEVTLNMSYVREVVGALLMRVLMTADVIVAFAGIDERSNLINARLLVSGVPVVVLRTRNEVFVSLF